MIRFGSFGRRPWVRALGVLAAAGALVALPPALVLTPAQAQAFDAEKHFKGRSIRIIVDFKPGGGTDIQARYFASNWSKFLPGNPRVTVANIYPNPSGRNYVWKAKPDGLTLNFNASTAIGIELVDDTAKFESAKFVQIGSHAKRDMVLLARGTVPYNTIPEAKGSPVQLVLAEPIASAGDLDGKLMATGMLALWFDVPLKIATVARSGTADGLLMLERGDINGYIAGSQWYALPQLRPGWFAKGFLKPIADLGHPDSPAVPNSEIAMTAPNAVTWLDTEQRELWNGIVLPEVLSGKSITAPPALPPELTKTLREAYAKAVNDPKFGAGLEKIQRQPVAYVSGEKLQAMVDIAAPAFQKMLPRYNELRRQIYDRYFKSASASAAAPATPAKIAGKIEAVEGDGQTIKIAGHEVRLNSSRSKITINGKSESRSAMKPGLQCAVEGAPRKGRYEAQTVTCR